MTPVASHDEDPVVAARFAAMVAQPRPIDMPLIAQIREAGIVFLPSVDLDALAPKLTADGAALFRDLDVRGFILVMMRSSRGPIGTLTVMRHRQGRAGTRRHRPRGRAVHRRVRRPRARERAAVPQRAVGRRAAQVGGARPAGDDVPRRDRREPAEHGVRQGCRSAVVRAVQPRGRGAARVPARRAARQERLRLLPARGGRVLRREGPRDPRERAAGRHRRGADPDRDRPALAPHQEGADRR